MILQLVCLIEVRQLAIGVNQMQLTLPKSPVKKWKQNMLLQHLQGVVRDAPNHPSQNPHGSLPLGLPGVRLQQVRLASLQWGLLQICLSSIEVRWLKICASPPLYFGPFCSKLYSQSPRPVSVCSGPSCSSPPPFQGHHELSQSPDMRGDVQNVFIQTVLLLPYRCSPCHWSRDHGG